MLLTLAMTCALRGLDGTRLTPEDPVLLGWRLVPGQELAYGYVSTQRVDGGEVRREEHWSYLVRDVDSEGVAYLEGRLTAFGSELVRPGMEIDPESLQDARESEEARLTAGTVALELAMDGRLVDLRAPTWGDALVHRLLALKLSEQPVVVGATWEDPGAARPLVDLLPLGLDVALEATQTFEGLYARGGRTQARVRTRAAVSTDQVALPGIWVQGDAWWDLSAGRLEERTLELSLLGDHGGDPGVLTLEARVLR